MRRRAGWHSVCYTTVVKVAAEAHSDTMATAYLQMIHIVVAATLLATDCGTSLRAANAAEASPPSEVHASLAHRSSLGAYTSDVGPETWEQQHQPLHTYRHDNGNQNYAATPAAASTKSTRRRSYSAGSGGNAVHSSRLPAPPNGLANLAGLRHISSDYDAAHGGGSAKQQIPIYEEQQENDYEAAVLASVAAAGYSGENNQHSSRSGASSQHATAGDALGAALYNLHAPASHNGFLPAIGEGGGGYEGGYGGGYGYNKPAAPTAPPSHQLQSNDKISDGNFLHHYEHNSGYDEYPPSTAASSYEQQHHLQYFAPHESTSASGGASPHAEALDTSYGEHQLQPPSGGSSYDDDTNYLPSAHGHAPEHHHATINYVPYPVVKKLHVPVREPVQIPVSHAVIVPVSKPVPIHIPITKQVQVPVEKELKIPVERVVPYPVEKHVPVPVEKRVPYPVVKYVPVKVPHPFPVKVPVFKTILHKVKSWW